MERFDEYPNVAARDEAWMTKAIKWSAFIQMKGQRFREDFASLPEAAYCAKQYEDICAHYDYPEKRALVYAITKEGHATMVPRVRWLAALEQVK